MSRMQNLSNFKGGMGRPILGFGLLLLTTGGGILISNSLFNVDGGHRAVMYSRVKGIKNRIYNEGTHIYFPWLEKPHIFDVRAKPRIINSLTGTKDLQMVNITVRVLSRPDVNKLPEILRTIGMDFDEKVLPSIVNEVLKSVVAKFNASQLVTQREHVSKQVRDHLVERSKNFSILLDDVSLTHVAFSPEFTRAVEAKQIAQQEALRASYIVDRAMQEKQSIIVKAQGEAKSAMLIGNAVKDSPEFLQLRMADVAREMAEKIKDGNNQVFIDSSLLMMDVNTKIDI